MYMCGAGGLILLIVRIVLVDVMVLTEGFSGLGLVKRKKVVTGD